MSAFWSAAGDRLGRGPGGGEAVAAGLVEKVPCKDCWIIPVQAPVDAVPPVCHGLDVGLVHGPAAGIDEEDIGVGGCASSFGPGCVLHSHTSYVNDKQGKGRQGSSQSLIRVCTARFCSTFGTRSACTLLPLQNVVVQQCSAGSAALS